MGDLISRSESIRRLKVMTNIEVIREGIKTAIAIIETQEDVKSVDMLEHANDNAPRWISVNDIVPDKDSEVLVCDKNGVIDIGFYNGTWHSCNTPYRITHWMPLPAAPEEG